MKAIRIIAIPNQCDAPEEARREWVGQIIPLATRDEIEDSPPTSSTGNHLVMTYKAMAILKSHRLFAAYDYWINKDYTRYMEFSPEVCEVIDCCNR